MLSGIYGTRKTKIAQLFAEYLCQNLIKKVPEDKHQEKRDEHIAFVPVHPDLLDNRGILGYYNILEQVLIKWALIRWLLP